MWNRATNVYPLDEDSGSTANDYSGNENHGTANGGAGPSGTGTSDGPFETTAWDFDGSDDYIDAASSTLRNNFDSAYYSYVFWFKRSTVSQEIPFWTTTSTTGFFGIRLNAGGDANIRLQNADAQLSVDNDYNDGEWHSVVVDCNDPNNNGLGNATLTVDGKSLGTIGDGGGRTDQPDTGPYIGRRSDTDSEYWNGSLSHVYIFDRGISPNESVWFHEVTERGKYRGPEITL